jgi:hypothetical protein
MAYGGKLLRMLTDSTPMAERGKPTRPSSPSIPTRSPSITEMPDVASDNPGFDPGMTSETFQSTVKEPSKQSRFSAVRGFIKGGGGDGSSKKLNSDDNDEKKRYRAAAKRARPLTRLVIASALLLFCATVLSISATFTTILLSPDTYIITFALLAAIEITMYALIIQTMSPIWQARRRRFSRSESATQLSPLSEDSVAVQNSKGSCCSRACTCLYNWWVI